MAAPAALALTAALLHVFNHSVVQSLLVFGCGALITATGESDMERARDELLARNRREADELKAQARREIEEQKVKALAEVKAVAVDLSIDIAEKLLGEKLDGSHHRKLAEQFMEQLPKGQAGQRSEARIV